MDLPAETFVFYFQGKPPLEATRNGGERHRFITVEFAPSFLAEHFRGHLRNAHPLVRSVVEGSASASVIVTPQRLAVTAYQLVDHLRHCPVFSPAREMWFRSKALEVAAHLFFQPEREEIIQKDRLRWHINYKDIEFFVNLDTMEKPDLGHFLEIKSRTWSRVDAERKAELALELIELLGATGGEPMTQDYIEVI